MFGLLLVQVVLAVLGGGLFFTSHEADMVHLADLVLRQSAGEVFHINVETPIGGWATLPMALLHRYGVNIGEAFIFGQIVALLVLFPAVTLISVNRLTSGQSLGFGLVVMGLAAGLVYGGTDPLVSLSMHYNRWCWAATLVICLAVLLPGRRDIPVPEGMIIGLLMAAMAMIKVTFAVALAVPIVFALLRNGRRKTLFVSVVSALVVLALITLTEGVGYWTAYLGDLRTVAGSANRAAPGAGWPALVLSPTGIPATLCVVALIYFSARIDRRDLGATVLVFFAAFTFITWQNFGNDPVWLIVVALVAWLLSKTSRGSGARGLRLTAVAAFALILPVLLNILWSPVRHLTLPAAMAQPLLPGEGGLRMVSARAESAFAKSVLIAPEDQVPTQLLGEPLPDCELTGGLVATLRRDADALKQLEPNIDRQPLVADLFQAHWLFSDLSPLRGGTPWYYDGLPGIADATHMLVPDCAADLRARARVTELVEASGLDLTEVGRTEAFRLYRINR